MSVHLFHKTNTAGHKGTNSSKHNIIQVNINKGTSDLNCTIDQVDLTDINKAVHATAAEDTTSQQSTEYSSS
jgi:hypothetical protein